MSLERFYWRVKMEEEEEEGEEEEKESQWFRDTTKNWSFERETFSLVTVAMAPGGHFDHSLLHDCMTRSYNIFHHNPLEEFSRFSRGFWEFTLVMFASAWWVSVYLCSRFLSIRQQEALTDWVWEVGGRNSRGLNHVSMSKTLTYMHTNMHTCTKYTFNITWADG